MTNDYHGSKSLTGQYPTAIHEVAVEFNNTIPKQDKYQHPEILNVKIATKRFEGESDTKVFVDLRFEINYKNESKQFCPLRYSWAKATKVVLLESEGDCDNIGEVPNLNAKSEVPAKTKTKAKAKAKADSDNKYDPTDADKQNAREEVEVYFLENSPEAEVTKVEFTGTHAGYGEVEVEFVKSDSGETLSCKNLYGFQFDDEKVFQIEIGDCDLK